MEGVACISHLTAPVSIPISESPASFSPCLMSIVYVRIVSMTKFEKQRKQWRQKNFRMVYFGSDIKEMQKAERDFWSSATPDQKHAAMRQFVADELERLGLSEYGPKLLRLTSMFRTP